MRMMLTRSLVILTADPFESTNNLTGEWTMKAQLIAAGIFILVGVVSSIAYSILGREGKGTVKKIWIGVLISVLGAFGAPSLINWLIDLVKSVGFGG